MLEIIRGTTQRIVITIYDWDGNVYRMQSGDVLRFGIKRDWQNTEYDVKKEVTNLSAQNDNYVINIDPEDTQNLPSSREYKFDIGLQTAAGDYYMVVPCSSCIILPAVTTKE